MPSKFCKVMLFTDAEDLLSPFLIAPLSSRSIAL